jgi:hypothetical protein
MVIGLVLLTIGLAAYASIPAIHRNSIVTTPENVWAQNAFPIQGGSIVEQPRNVTVFSSMDNELRAHLTVWQKAGELSSVHFELLSMIQSSSCSPSSRSPIVLIDQIVSNQSFNVPLNATGTYCFVFDNQSSQSLKSIDISAQVTGKGEQVLVARDGNANTFGLGLGALGLVVAIYGYSRKTVIPWE